MWGQGDYPAVARLLEPGAIRLADACHITPGRKVLDVAAGTGNFALAAEARGALVTACDFTPHMIDLGRSRSESAGRLIDWVPGDAEDLPFPDRSFDLVASVFGAMFAPRPDLVTSELFRVCRGDGLVAMANYSWGGFLWSMAKLFEKYSQRLAFELPSPFEWGDQVVVRRRLATLARDIDIQTDVLTWTFASVDVGLEFWERTNGPTLALKMTTPPDRYAAFLADTRSLMDRLNSSTDGRLELTSSYVRVLARR